MSVLHMCSCLVRRQCFITADFPMFLPSPSPPGFPYIPRTNPARSRSRSNPTFGTGRRVYFLDMTTGTELDISTRAAQLFMAPSTHCEGGEDAVILVETDSDESGQHLVSARVDGSAKKRLCPVRCARVLRWH